MTSHEKLSFVEEPEFTGRQPQFWQALVMPGEEIDREIERLASLSPDARRGRRSMVVHPEALGGDLALAPSIDIALNVVAPGERTSSFVQNASRVCFCIRGQGRAVIAGRTIPIRLFDAWNVPSMERATYENSEQDLLVFLSYSNSPLLKKLQVYYEDHDPVTVSPSAEGASTMRRARDAALNIQIGSDGARILGYEYLIDIDVVPSKPLHWPWAEVSKHLGAVEHYGGVAGAQYRGRHLVALYNPATGRRNGTTHSFFATIAQYPPGRVDTPHRHTSAAINYIFAGSGRSNVRGHKFSWRAGDLMLSAPGWAVHHHASSEEGCNILTVQDHPLHIASESLIWQESLQGPIIKLGGEVGVQTNVEQFAGDQ
jgi:gentisate 1,2-dioxygenase